jgi:hypothetical protein
MQIKRRKTTPPKWLAELPAGQYTAQELMSITGLTMPGMTRTLIKYGVQIVKQGCYRNLYMNIYIWEGIKNT